MGYNTDVDYSFIKNNYRELEGLYDLNIFGPYDIDVAYNMAVAHGYNRITCDHILEGKVFYDYETKLIECEMNLDSDDDDDSDSETNTAMKCEKHRQGTAKTVSGITFDTEPITVDSSESGDNSDESPPPELFIPSQCLMTNARTNAFPYMRTDRYYSLDSNSNVKFTEEITKKRKNTTDDDVNDAGHTPKIKRQHNNNDADVSIDGQRKMAKDTESKYKLLQVATMMKNRTNVHNKFATTDDDDNVSFTTSGTKTTKTKTKMTNKGGAITTTCETEQTTSSNNQTSNKTSNPKMKPNDDVRTTKIDQTEFETNGNIEENCTEVIKLPAEAVEKENDDLVDYIRKESAKRMRMLQTMLAALPEFLEGCNTAKNAQTKNAPTNDDKPEVNQRNHDEPEVQLRDEDETPIPYQGQKSLTKSYRRPTVYELKLLNSCRRKHKKRYTTVFDLDTSYTTTTTTQQMIRGNHGIPAPTKPTSAIFFQMIKIDNRYPDEWNGNGPVEYAKPMTFTLLKIADRYPDEWNGHYPAEYAAKQ